MLIMLSIFLLELTMNVITVQQHSFHESLYHNNKKLQNIIITFLAVLPSISQDIARMYTKFSSGYIFQLFLHTDWMDGQGSHVEATRLSLFIKSISTIIMLSYFSILPHKQLMIKSIHLSALGLIAMAWSKSQFFNEKAYEMDYIAHQLKPFNLLTQNVQNTLSGNIVNGHIHTHTQPFVVLAYQRTGSNWLCGRLHNHREILMHSEVFNENKIYYYHTTGEKGGGFHPFWKWNIFTRNQYPENFLLELFTNKVNGNQFNLKQLDLSCFLNIGAAIMNLSFVVYSQIKISKKLY